MKAHRVAYELWVGPIPAGHSIDHECHNKAHAAGLCAGGPCEHRRCCNPAHLIPRRIWDNASRGASPAALNARKEVCSEGHEFEVIRICRTCTAAASKRYREKNAMNTSMVIVRDEPPA